MQNTLTADFAKSNESSLAYTGCGTFGVVVVRPSVALYVAPSAVVAGFAVHTFA